LTIKINKATFENACKDIIETILFCLPNAFKGTVYQIGRPPELIAKCVTSGIIDKERKIISWGGAGESDYVAPGKPWLDYRDQPGRALEAMAWCVEKQHSWTAEEQKNDIRSVRLQVEGVKGDCHHMEPVLMLKKDLSFRNQSEIEYPKNHNGDTVWADSDYVVVDVIKIHFRPGTIKKDGPETKIINRLSQALGTELLSNQLSLQSVEAMRKVGEDRLNSCNILADSLRNAITKSGLLFSLIKLELGFLRQQWEEMLLEHSDQKGMKRDAVQMLNEIINSITKPSDISGKNLLELQNEFLNMFLPPESGEKWVDMQIKNKWSELLHKKRADESLTKEVHRNIHQLKRALHRGKDPDNLALYQEMPKPLKSKWVDLIYSNTNGIDFHLFNRLIDILGEPSLKLPHQNKSRKSLIHLKALAEIMAQLETSTNVILREVLNGHDYQMTSSC